MEALDKYLQDTMDTAAFIAAAYRSDDIADASAIALLAEEALATPVPDGGPHPWTALLGALILQTNGDVPLARRRIGMLPQAVAA